MSNITHFSDYNNDRVPRKNTLMLSVLLAICPYMDNVCQKPTYMLNKLLTKLAEYHCNGLTHSYKHGEPTKSKF